MSTFDVTAPLPASQLLTTMLNINLGSIPANLFAYGDGIHDDTLAIQNAIYAAWTLSQGGQAGGIVYFPAGTYLLGTPGNPGASPNLYNAWQRQSCWRGRRCKLAGRSNVTLPGMSQP
jgi:hypothetical protein